MFLSILAKRRLGFTLVELLVVIAIIGILVALLLPAVQSAREAARRTQCANNLKQIALAVLNFETAQKRFPPGGWGWAWVGDPDQPMDRRQPGGWGSTILPYVEQSNLIELSKGKTFDQKKVQNAIMVSTAVIAYYCPSRRQAKEYPNSWSADKFTAFNVNGPDNLGRSDYAINAGSTGVPHGSGPTTIKDGNDNTSAPPNQDGIAFERSEITIQMVTDGMTNTILFGEKFIPPMHYTTGKDGADNESCFTGNNNDTNRSAGLNYLPMQDRNGVTGYEVFGSAHAAGLQLALCDGSVRGASYSVDAELWRRVGSRNDGQTVNLGGL